MNYLINPDISEEIDGRETDPSNENITPSLGSLWALW